MASKTTSSQFAAIDNMRRHGTVSRGRGGGGFNNCCWGGEIRDDCGGGERSKSTSAIWQWQPVTGGRDRDWWRWAGREHYFRNLPPHWSLFLGEDSACFILMFNSQNFTLESSESVPLGRKPILLDKVRPELIQFLIIWCKKKVWKLEVEKVMFTIS